MSKESTICAEEFIIVELEDILESDKLKLIV